MVTFPDVYEKSSTKSDKLRQNRGFNGGVIDRFRQCVKLFRNCSAVGEEEEEEGPVTCASGDCEVCVGGTVVIFLEVPLIVK